MNWHKIIDSFGQIEQAWTRGFDPEEDEHRILAVKIREGLCVRSSAISVQPEHWKRKQHKPGSAAGAQQNDPSGRAEALSRCVTIGL